MTLNRKSYGFEFNLKLICLNEYFKKLKFSRATSASVTIAFWKTHTIASASPIMAPDLTHSMPSFVRYEVEDSKIYSTSTRAHEISLNYKTARLG